ncbi:MAG: hypothetical protein ACYSUN_02750 [Planctomycetota bacterium]|jgi:hypothetical protein
MKRSRKQRSKPELKLEVIGLGTVDPFSLQVIEQPAGSGDYFVEDPHQTGRRTKLDVAGLSLAGAGQALLTLSMRWMRRAGRPSEPDPLGPPGEVRMVVRRREARLIATLLRRHLDRLPQPPGWMPELLEAMEQVDEFLRWEDA